MKTFSPTREMARGFLERVQSRPAVSASWWRLVVRALTACTQHPGDKQVWEGGHGKRESGEGSLLARPTPGGGGGRGTTGCLDWEQPVPSRIGRTPWFPEGWPRFHTLGLISPQRPGSPVEAHQIMSQDVWS